MHHSDDPRRLSLALTCYCDDSGTHDESKVAVIGAVLMSKPRFMEFYADWEKLLKEFRIEGIHMRDFVRPYGRYCAMLPEMKRALFTSVAKVINQKKEYSVSAAVPQADYVTLMSVPVCRELMGPYAMAFLTLVMINLKASLIRKYNNRIAYLVDKGIHRHHEQMSAAHTLMLHVEHRRGEKHTGAMAGDTDDNNLALQAADVIAWSYHRQLESGELGEEFFPLMDIFKESQVPARPDGAVYKPHINFPVPEAAIIIFAALINQWLTATGTVPTWERIWNDSLQLPKAKDTMTASEYEKFNATMKKLVSVTHNELKARLDAERAAKKEKKVKANDNRDKNND
jgi:uncharacterized protein DUF3800